MNQTRVANTTTMDRLKIIRTLNSGSVLGLSCGSCSGEHGNIIIGTPGKQYTYSDKRLQELCDIGGEMHACVTILAEILADEVRSRPVKKWSNTKGMAFSDGAWH